MVFEVWVLLVFKLCVVKLCVLINDSWIVVIVVVYGIVILI